LVYLPLHIAVILSIHSRFQIFLSNLDEYVYQGTKTGKVVPVHAVRADGGFEVLPHSFLTSALDASE